MYIYTYIYRERDRERETEREKVFQFSDLPPQMGVFMRVAFRSAHWVRCVEGACQMHLALLGGGGSGRNCQECNAIIKSPQNHYTDCDVSHRSFDCVAV